MTIDKRVLNKVLHGLDKLPAPGEPGWEAAADRMRADLDRWEQERKLVSTARKLIEADGRDFDEEFRMWKAKREGSDDS